MDSLNLEEMTRSLKPNELHIVHRRNGEIISEQISTNLRTNAGADFQAQQMGGTPGTAANRIALTEDGTAPSVADTTLTGEITNNGLERAVATFSHAGGGATSYTLSHTFTKSGGTSVTIQKAGCFDAATGGNMVFETLFGDPATLVSGDELTVTWTVNI